MPLTRASLLLAVWLVGCPSPMPMEEDASVASCAEDTDCDDGVGCNGAERCGEGFCMPGTPLDCDDGDDCTQDACEGDACVNTPRDSDGDGHGATECGGDDCDDEDPRRFPGNTEVCEPDGVDEDCDPATFGTRDADRDEFIDSACCNGATCGDDCADNYPGVHPGESEVCDGLDNDCDDTADEGVTGTFYRDEDGDGFGSDADDAEQVEACRAPEGFAGNRTDCDDMDRRANPSLPEVCDDPGEGAARDEDCDGTANPSGLCNCTGTGSRECALPGACAEGTERCVDGRWTACSVEAVIEVCNGEDNDCDGTIDEGLRIVCWTDNDNDRYPGEEAERVERCPVTNRSAVAHCPSGTTNLDPDETVHDCNDFVATISPNAAESLNMRDDDCDDVVDEGVE